MAAPIILRFHTKEKINLSRNKSPCGTSNGESGSDKGDIHAQYNNDYINFTIEKRCKKFKPRKKPSFLGYYVA